MADLTDNTAAVLKKLQTANASALELIGQRMEHYAKDLAPVRSGDMKRSIKHKVDDGVLTFYSDSPYAPYQELGTGKHYTPSPEWMENNAQRGTHGPNGPWWYKDDNGNWHQGWPVRPQPFMRPAVENHTDEYQKIMENELKNG